MFDKFHHCPSCGKKINDTYVHTLYFRLGAVKVIKRKEKCHHCILCNTLYKYVVKNNTRTLHQVKTNNTPILTDEQQNIIDRINNNIKKEIRLKKIKNLLRKKKKWSILKRVISLIT